MGEKLSPEEYRRLEGITPQDEKFNLLSDAERVEREAAAQANLELPDQPDPDKLENVLASEGIQIPEPRAIPKETVNAETQILALEFEHFPEHIKSRIRETVSKYGSVWKMAYAIDDRVHDLAASEVERLRETLDGILTNYEDDSGMHEEPPAGPDIEAKAAERLQGGLETVDGILDQIKRRIEAVQGK